MNLFLYVKIKNDFYESPENNDFFVFETMRNLVRKKFVCRNILHASQMVLCMRHPNWMGMSLEILQSDLVGTQNNWCRVVSH